MRADEIDKCGWYSATMPGGVPVPVLITSVAGIGAAEIVYPSGFSSSLRTVSPAARFEPLKLSMDGWRVVDPADCGSPLFRHPSQGYRKVEGLPGHVRAYIKQQSEKGDPL